MSKSWIEKTAEALRLIPSLPEYPQLGEGEENLPGLQVTELEKFPPPERWKDWEEYEATQWPKRVKRRYHLVPTTCFNCESACGLMAYVDKDAGAVRRFEGNPHHPGSRGRLCAKGPATINQINDPERILYPLKRKGPRGAGQWERIGWEQALQEIAAGIRTALEEERHNEIVYHVGRPGHAGYMDRVLRAWGVDGHNSHTNVCSSGARLGYAIWQGIDRLTPDYANAHFILLLSSHLETGHYFNPHAQRIVDGMMNGAHLAVMDPRLSNTASLARYWMPTTPGSEAAVLLAMARVILAENLFNREFMEEWVNWREYLTARFSKEPHTFDHFIEKLLEVYAEFTPGFAAAEADIDPELIVTVARRIGAAGTRFAADNWRGPAAGHLGGWQVSRALHFLNVLTGAVGAKGGSLPNAWNKFHPTFFDDPPAQKFWNELHFPDEYPLAHFELSPILPHMLKDGRGRIDTYFTRVFNPVWTYPDGFSWIEVLREQKFIGTHIALTPTWNETAYYADYVLPMGLASERHDLNSYETHSGTWIAFRQPVLRRFLEEQGKPVEFTHQANPGEVWEEDEFWIELSWRIDPDGKLGIRKHFLSPYRKGEKVTIEEYYRYIFERVPGLEKEAAREGMDPYQYMTHYGAFEVEPPAYEKHLAEVGKAALKGARKNKDTGLIVGKGGESLAVEIKGKPRVGFSTPSRLQEFFSPTLEEWGWPEYAIPGYIKSHVHRDNLDPAKNEYVLLPNFRLPNLIHSRSSNSKWLVEIAHRNPVWMNSIDAKRFGFATGDLVKLVTDIGSFIDKVWVTEAIKPGVIACSHHIGRWKPSHASSVSSGRGEDTREYGEAAAGASAGVSRAGNSWATNTVDITEEAPGQWKMSLAEGIRPFRSSDPDSARIYWRDGGVHQNITHAVHPDPISGMHCWHQRVRVEIPGPGENYGDVRVDTNKSFQVYKEWLAMTRPPQRKDGLRRPKWLIRPLRPADEAYYKKG